MAAGGESGMLSGPRYLLFIKKGTQAGPACLQIGELQNEQDDRSGGIQTVSVSL